MTAWPAAPSSTAPDPEGSRCAAATRRSGAPADGHAARAAAHDQLRPARPTWRAAQAAAGVVRRRASALLSGRSPAVVDLRPDQLVVHLAHRVVFLGQQPRQYG